MNVALVSDFFFPAVGGCEVHLEMLSTFLVKRGHKVIIITHSVGKCTLHCLVCTSFFFNFLLSDHGVIFRNGVKVYYIAQLPFYNNTSFPTIFGTTSAVWKILTEEAIDMVHGHSAFSVLAHEALMHASVMNLHTCFTDHSLFGFQDASAILTNKLLQASLAGVSHVICVSYTSKENTVLRSHVDPERVAVIGNAINASQFTPDIKARDSQWITIGFCARLELRKGADLLAQLLPRMCKLPRVRFIIGGDGKKRPMLEEIRDLYGLQDRVTFLGHIAHNEVRNLLVQCDLFLNTSLTEAFCMAIVEAACCGCYVVSTNVGGIPEVLPEDMISLADANCEDLYEKLSYCIENELYKVNTNVFHERIASMYDWNVVAEKTEKVYRSCLKKGNRRNPREILMRFQEKCGPFWGKIFCFLWTLDFCFMYLIRMFSSCTK